MALAAATDVGAKMEQAVTQWAGSVYVLQDGLESSVIKVSLIGNRPVEYLKSGGHSSNFFDLLF